MQAEKTIRMRSLVKMGFSLTDIKNIFESTADEISLELDLDVINTIDHTYKFNFDSYVNVEEQAVLCTVAGYVAHGIMKTGISCHSCSQIVSPGKMPLEIYFEMINEPNAVCTRRIYETDQSWWG